MDLEIAGAVCQVLGNVSDVPQVVVDHDLDAVIVVGAQLSGAALRRLSWALERTGAELLVEPGLVEVTGPNVSVRPAAGLSLLHLEAPSPRGPTARQVGAGPHLRHVAAVRGDAP